MTHMYTIIRLGAYVTKEGVDTVLQRLNETLNPSLTDTRTIIHNNSIIVYTVTDNIVHIYMPPPFLVYNMLNIYNEPIITDNPVEATFTNGIIRIYALGLTYDNGMHTIEQCMDDDETGVHWYRDITHDDDINYDSQQPMPYAYEQVGSVLLTNEPNV